MDPRQIPDPLDIPEDDDPEDQEKRLIARDNRRWAAAEMREDDLNYQ